MRLADPVEYRAAATLWFVPFVGFPNGWCIGLLVCEVDTIELVMSFPIFLIKSVVK